MKVALVDDTLEELKILTNILDNELPEAEVDTFPDGESFLKVWKTGTYDLIILDIYMEEILGVDVARKIRETDRDVRIVFCTTSNEFASESYEVNANYYLQKPVSATSFQRMLQMIHLSDYELNRFITLPDGQKIVLRNITFTEYYNHTIIIHSKKRADLQTRISQTEWELLLSKYDFLYSCSKGIVVNFHEIERQESNLFIMKNGENVPISRRKSKEVSEAFAHFRFEQMRKGGN